VSKTAHDVRFLSSNDQTGPGTRQNRHNWFSWVFAHVSLVEQACEFGLFLLGTHCQGILPRVLRGGATQTGLRFFPQERE
jgi:hypothetical protein